MMAFDFTGLIDWGKTETPYKTHKRKGVPDISAWPHVVRIDGRVIEKVAGHFRDHGHTVLVRCARPGFGTGLLWIGRRSKARQEACGARTRRGTDCRAKAIEGVGRCRMHGGLSTGPKTEEGRDRIRESNRRRAQARRAADVE